MIRVVHDAQQNGVTVYRYDNLGNGESSYWTHDGRRKTVKPGETGPWWLVLNYDDADALLSALSDALTDSALPPAAYLQGELKATKLHLDDMRKLALLEPAKEEA